LTPAKAGGNPSLVRQGRWVSLALNPSYGPSSGRRDERRQQR
jgi:hypothetical protein